MTYEEAITIIKNEFSKYADTLSVYAEKRKMAFDMAIKTLEQQQYIHDTCKKCVEFSEFKQQPCEDCISREAVKEMLTEEWTKYMPMELDINLSFVLEKISELPSVTPSRPKGKRLHPFDVKEWLDSFNTESAPQCFNIIQDLKREVEKECI